MFSGSLSSDVWVSDNGGEFWSQIEWPQPDAGQFGVPGAIGGFCVTSIAVGPDSARWRVERNPRAVADITGDRCADIVGFGDTGVWTARGNGDGTFNSMGVVLADFGYEAGGWRVDKHPRFLADVRGQGLADIVGFGDAGVYIAFSNGDGTFSFVPLPVIDDFGYEAGDWRVDKHPRVLADLRGNGRADIIGFGDAGVYVALSNGDGTFSYTPQPVINDFCYDTGWRVDKHPRFVADVTGNGFADIVGFGDAGVYIAFGNGDGTFSYTPQPVIDDFCYDTGWRVDRHPRFLADVKGLGRSDIVGFGDAGVYIAFSNGDRTFSFTPQPVINDFGYDAGGWRVEKHPRLLADLQGNGRADVVGFGDAGVYVALSNGDGTFSYTPQPVINDFCYDTGWRVDKHPRFLADLQGNGRADVVGFGDAGVYIALSNGDGTFAITRFVLPNFGYEVTVLAIVQSDRKSQDAGIWRSSDRGHTWSPIHSFPRVAGAARLPGAGQLVWAAGTANFVYAAGASALALSTDGGANFTNVMPTFAGGFQAINHVAAAATPVGTLRPPIVYALLNTQMFVSFDAGTSWIKDQGTIPVSAGGAVGLANSQNECVLVVSSRSSQEVFLTANANMTPPAILRGDYSQFQATQTSSWEFLPLPNLGQQYSGNVFVAAPRAGQGEVLFYGPQRSKTFVAPLLPASASDWVELDNGQHVHVDLHGIFLSPDFSATFQDGVYRRTAGTVWMASDGGIFRSTDGGQNFQPATNINTLSCVNIAGVALQGKGPVISLNTGDNDGFCSTNGGASWQPQNYGGGDDDCSFADPLRPQSMLIFTPRWDEHGAYVGGGLGQTVALYEAESGNLPDISSSDMRHMVPGPPLRTKSTIWNASSGFGLRGFRPIVPNMPGDDANDPGDYVLIRFFGNFSDPSIPLTLPNNLAILLRTQSIRDIKKRTDWETPGGWRVQKHPRLLGDLTGNGRADIVGFGDAGIWTALSKVDGTFADPHFVLADFGYEAGGWRVDRHPRFLADVKGLGRVDVVGFGDAGVYIAFSNGDGSFSFTPLPVIDDFGYEAGGWRVDKHPRFLADVRGQGLADIVGFGDAGVYIAFSNGDGTFSFVPLPVIDDFGYEAGDWRVDKHPRVLADLRGNGRADIIGFGDAGVYVALSNGDGTFSYTPQPVINDFCYDTGWRVDKHPRFVADVTGNGFADIVGFGDAGVYIAFGNGDGTFSYTPQPVIDDFCYDTGWRVDRHPRFLADVKGLGRSDIVGFGDAGVYIAFSNGDRTFSFTPQPVINDFGYDAGGWRVEKHPRLLADLQGNGRADVVGFGDAGVLISLSQGNGSFSPLPLFVIPNFGYGDSGPVVQQGPFLPAVDAGIVQASGGHSGTVFYVGGDSANQLWKWTDGMPNWQQLVPGGGARVARRFFVNPYIPTIIYLLDVDLVMRSDDGGVTWQADLSLEQQLTCGGLIPANRGQDDDGQGDHLDVVLTDMQFDPFNPWRRFAVGLGGAFMTGDGMNWERLLDTGALRGRPANCYFDWISQPAQPALYVSFAGRSIVKIMDLPKPRTPNVRTTDGHVGMTRPMPDNRALISLDDGRSFVVDAENLTPQADGIYLLDRADAG